MCKTMRYNQLSTSSSFLLFTFCFRCIFILIKVCPFSFGGCSSRFLFFLCFPPCCGFYACRQVSTLITASSLLSSAMGFRVLFGCCLFLLFRLLFLLLSLLLLSLLLLVLLFQRCVFIKRWNSALF